MSAFTRFLSYMKEITETVYRYSLPVLKVYSTCDINYRFFVLAVNIGIQVGGDYSKVDKKLIPIIHRQSLTQNLKNYLRYYGRRT